MEVITRPQFEAFVAAVGESLSEAARNESQDSARAALNGAAHIFESFDIDWLFNPQADHNLPKGIEE